MSRGNRAQYSLSQLSPAEQEAQKAQQCKEREQSVKEARERMASGSPTGADYFVLSMDSSKDWVKVPRWNGD